MIIPGTGFNGVQERSAVVAAQSMHDSAQHALMTHTGTMGHSLGAHARTPRAQPPVRVPRYGMWHNTVPQPNTVLNAATTGSAVCRTLWTAV